MLNLYKLTDEMDAPRAAHVDRPRPEDCFLGAGRALLDITDAYRLNAKARVRLLDVDTLEVVLADPAEMFQAPRERYSHADLADHILHRVEAAREFGLRHAERDVLRALNLLQAAGRARWGTDQRGRLMASAA